VICFNIVKDCEFYFAFEVPRELWVKRVNKLEQKIANCDNNVRR